jgi:hypothetical protein
MWLTKPPIISLDSAHTFSFTFPSPFANTFSLPLFFSSSATTTSTITFKSSLISSTSHLRDRYAVSPQDPEIPDQ